MKRITFIIYSAFPAHSGGRETWLFNISSRLLSRGWKVRICAYYQVVQAPFFHMPSHPSLKLIRLPTLRSLPWVGKLFARRYLAILSWMLFWVQAFWLVLLGTAVGETVLTLGPLLEGVPLVWARLLRRKLRYVCAVRGFHAAELTRRYPLLRGLLYRLELITLREADLILANGHDTQEYVASLGLQAEVAPNGVDFQRFADFLPQESAPPSMQPAPTVLMVATLREIKGVPTLIRAAAELTGQYGPEVRFILVGKGDPAPFGALAAELGVDRRVFFEGQRSDIARYLQAASVVAAFSHGGGMSMSLLEAMAAGKPIVSWDTATFRQLLVSEVSGLLVPPDDPPALANAIQRLLQDGDLGRRLGAAAQRAARQYDWEQIVERLLGWIADEN